MCKHKCMYVCLYVLNADTELIEVGGTDHGEKIISLLRSYVVEVVTTCVCTVLYYMQYNIQ